MIKQMLTCVLLLILIGHHDVRTATVNMESSVGVLGNNPHNVKCSYNLASGETLLILEMSQIVNGVQTVLGNLYDSGDPVWDGNAPSDIKRRSLLIKLDPTTLQLFYNDTVCSDEKNYTCSVTFRSAEGTRSRQSSNKVTIEASPGAPTMTAVPGYNITENTTVTFTCTGNVGKPPGQFQWYMYKGSNRENKTDKATPQSNTLATSSCTYTGRSSINITMTRMEQNIVMRCRVYHPTQGNNTNIEDCTNPDTGFCRNGERMFVSYPVSISLSPQTPAITADQGSEYILTCNAEGYPPPQLRWYKNSDPNNTLGTNRLVNNTLETSITLKLQNLSLSDSGVYVCIGTNNINGAELNDSKQVEITVVRTTTPPPTTTSTKTTTNSKATTTASSGVTDPVKDIDNTAAITAGVIVPVVVIIIIVIIVVCVCRRRAAKKSPVEEPPEKPFNNHSRINTISSRPDLVSSEKTYPAFDNSKAFVNEDGLTYAQLQLDNKPRSRRPLALDDSHTDYSDISMPQV